MKLMKAMIEITRERGATEYIGYPDIWMSNKERIPAILYPNDRTEDTIIDGKLFQPLFLVVPDDLVDSFIQHGIEVASSLEAFAFSEKHAPSKEYIEDSSLILSIVAKSVRGESLSAKEKDSLNPKSPERGVSVTKSFFQIAKDYGCDNLT